VNEHDAWIAHSLRLIQARVVTMEKLEKADKNHTDPDPRKRDALRYELRMVTYCYQRRDEWDTFIGEYAVWWEYLVHHAALQIERDAGRLAESDFLVACAVLRAERDEALG